MRHAIPHPYPHGARVRNYGEQWPEAMRRGTAAVLEAAPNPDGTYEYRVLRDEPLLPGTDCETWWSSRHTYLATEAEL